jgi:serine/threonine protein kinase
MDDWQKINELFHAALKLDPAERRDFLARHCDGDEEIIRDVESLLDAQMKAEGFLDQPVFIDAGRTRKETDPPDDDEDQSPAYPALAPNTLLRGRYRIIQQLGRGGMGAVYQATDETLSCLVAVKETFAETDKYRRAFEREAKLLANLRHPVLPRVTDHFTEGRGQFLVMEFIPGHDLAELLQLRGRPFDADKVLRWADQLLDALEELHSNDPPIVHRDIKPANLKLTPRGDIILLDFGLAKGVAGQMEAASRDRSIYAYTQHYAPLEQIRGERTGPRSDLYALGATLWNLLAAQVPPDALGRVIDREEGRGDPLRPAHELNERVPPEVSGVIQQAMAINRNERPASARAMRQSLRAATPMEVRGSESATIIKKDDPETQSPASDQSTLARSKQTVVIKTDSAQGLREDSASKLSTAAQTAAPAFKRAHLAAAISVIVILIALFLIFRRPSNESAGFSSSGAQVTINIDTKAERHPISPLIYGVSQASYAALSDLNSPLNRSGGEPASRYNWQLNAENQVAHSYFESIPYPSPVAGEAADTFIANTKAAGAQPMITIPTIGWVARLGKNRSRLASFSRSKYGPQAESNSRFRDAGNGIRPDGSYITGNDPTDANVAADSLFQQRWVEHLVSRWGAAQSGGLRYYVLDNEPSIWHATHRDVRPQGATMDEIRNKIIDYATKIKSVDPEAQVVGPEEWGWTGYLLSGYDQQYGYLHGYSNQPDRAAHGGWDYLPWLLDQLRQHEEATGQRLLDFFSVHCYPQGGEYGDDVSNQMQLRRNRSTRSLWDPNYTDESWVEDVVRLVPRLREWVTNHYPGTKTAITEYDWGAENHINGATAQADILGIFGREGLDMAARWTAPNPSTPTYKAMKMYRNYDGNKSTFGDTSVRAAAPNPDNVSAFAALRSSDGALTVMVINKQLSESAQTTLRFAGFSQSGKVEVWQLTSVNAITRLSDISFTGASFAVSLPQQSITLFVIRQSAS